MSADNLLASIRNAQCQLDALAEAPDDDPRVLDLLTAIVHDVSDLDAYLANGGALPEQWQAPHPTAS